MLYVLSVLYVLFMFICSVCHLCYPSCVLYVSVIAVICYICSVTRVPCALRVLCVMCNLCYALFSPTRARPAWSRPVPALGGRRWRPRRAGAAAAAAGGSGAGRGELSRPLGAPRAASLPLAPERSRNPPGEPGAAGRRSGRRRHPRGPLCAGWGCARSGQDR